MSIRQRTGQLMFWFFCGEWLLLQRRWLSSSTIALLTLLVLARAWLLQTVALVPYYRYAGLVVALVAVVRFFKALSLATRRRRAHYNVPPWGLPWTSFLIGPRPVPSALGSKLIEPLTAFAVSGALVALDRVVLPPLTSLVTLTHLPALAPWDTWIRLHPLDAAQCAIYTPVLMLALHNVAEWRVMHPRPARQRKVQAADFFPRVRARRLSLPPVPSVATLAKRFNRRYGVG